MSARRENSRQQPGSACDDCRRRKLRCDRQQPCGNCTEADILCRMRATRPPRGPKKGHLRVLRNQLEALESRMNEQEKVNRRVVQLPSSEDYSCSTNRHQSTGSTSSSYADEDLLQDALDELVNSKAMPVDSTSATFDFKLNPFDMVTPIEPGLEWTPAGKFTLTDLAREDLDQLYFDRVHPFAPMIHRRRYLSWSRRQNASQPQMCLQYSIWTIAASQSSQFAYQRDSLYHDARQMLERLDLDDTIIDPACIEQAQAWILLSTYEFMFNRYQRGLISAGRAFRCIQLMRLNEVDSSNSIVQSKNLVEEEMGRRAFWVAFMIDRFVSAKNGFPLTLNEQEISTRLPVPEAKFQSSQSVIMPFLSEVVSGVDAENLVEFSSPFTECIIATTIWGRSIMHRNSSRVDPDVDATSDFCERYRWLDSILQTRLRVMSLQEQSNAGLSDPTLIFVVLISTTNILFLNNLIYSLPGETEQLNKLILGYKQLSSSTTKVVTPLVEALTQLNHFQIHPFMPIPLALCAEYILANPELNKSLRPQLRDILDLLGSLRAVNNLAQAYYPMLELDEMCLDYINL